MDAFDNNAPRDFDLRLQKEKLAALQAFAYGASHEINNPLANISMRAQALLAKETDSAKRELLNAIYRQAMRAHAMIADMMTYASPPLPNITLVDLRALAEKAIQEAEEPARIQGTSLQLGGEIEEVAVSVDANQILLALRALIDNGLESLVRGGKICIEVSSNNAQPGKMGGASVTVRDNGPGMTDEVRRHSCDPFYSGREAGRGLGFGLPKCWAIMQQHGGRLEIDSILGRGTSVSLHFAAQSMPETEGS